MNAEQLQLDIEGGARVSGLFIRPPRARAMYVFAHGAGASMTHVFMEDLARSLAGQGVATLRFNFPFMEAMGSRRWSRPDPPAVAHGAIHAAVRMAITIAEDLPLFAGGKSFGARMTSQAYAQQPLTNVKALVFIGYPLHLAKKPATSRAEHLVKVHAPMLFVQGSRDALADAGLISSVCAGLPQSSLRMIDGADHGFNTPVRTGRRSADVIEEIAQSISIWIAERCGASLSDEVTKAP